MFRQDQCPHPIAIVGSTATGKSALGLALALELGGAIVGADAMQLYRGLDVGTAKTPVVERRGIPHFQIDELEVTENASVAAYQRHARDDIAKLGNTPAIVVGGSGLYLRALLEPIEFPGENPQVRQRLNEELAEQGPAALHARLAALDPVAAEVIHPRNGRRIVRALEVIEITGKPFSASLPTPQFYYPGTVQLGIRVPPAELHERIRRRTAAMFAEGILEEAKLLRDLPPTATAAKATGYREALQVLDGEMTLEQAEEQVSLATRQLAARQNKWFRRDSRIHWLDSGEDLLKRALAVLNQDDSEALAGSEL